jgi:hypothetical protein
MLWSGISFWVLSYFVYAVQIESVPFYQVVPTMLLQNANQGPVWQGSGSSKNGSGFGSSGGVASLVELSRFKKRLAK